MLSASGGKGNAFLFDSFWKLLTALIYCVAKGLVIHAYMKVRMHVRTQVRSDFNT